MRCANNAADTQLKMKLLFFFQNRHPYAKCSLGVISRAVSRVRKVDLEEALEGLVMDEIIEKHTNQQGQLFYCLTTDPKMREPGFILSAGDGNSNAGCQPVSDSGSRHMIN